MPLVKMKFLWDYVWSMNISRDDRHNHFCYSARTSMTFGRMVMLAQMYTWHSKQIKAKLNIIKYWWKQLSSVQFRIICFRISNSCSMRLMYAYLLLIFTLFCICMMNGRVLRSLWRLACFCCHTINNDNIIVTTTNVLHKQINNIWLFFMVSVTGIVPKINSNTIIIDANTPKR